MTANQPSGSRGPWIAQVYRRGEDPGDDLSTTTSATERLEMVAILSARMWELTGRPTPCYTREAIPVQVLRRS